ncbi:MAG: hypothetical protein JXB38_01160 [Anaerolineales bacterium]|nr:hypothetical protein [Anaerolineales bacterium]
MLNQIIQAIEAAEGSIDLHALSRQLDIEPGALQGMLDFLVRKGRIQTGDDLGGDCCTPQTTCSSCAKACPGPQNCHFVVKLPKTYMINLDEKRQNRPQNLV